MHACMTVFHFPCLQWISHLESNSKLVKSFFTLGNLHISLKCSRNDTINEVAPEDAEDEGAGEEEVEYGDSHPANLDGEA